MKLRVRLPNGKTYEVTQEKLSAAYNQNRLPNGTEVCTEGSSWMSTEEWLRSVGKLNDNNSLGTAADARLGQQQVSEAPKQQIHDNSSPGEMSTPPTLSQEVKALRTEVNDLKGRVDSLTHVLNASLGVQGFRDASNKWDPNLFEHNDEPDGPEMLCDACGTDYFDPVELTCRSCFVKKPQQIGEALTRAIILGPFALLFVGLLLAEAPFAAAFFIPLFAIVLCAAGAFVIFLLSRLTSKFTTWSGSWAAAHLGGLIASIPTFAIVQVSTKGRVTDMQSLMGQLGAAGLMVALMLGLSLIIGASLVYKIEFKRALKAYWPPAALITVTLGLMVLGMGQAVSRYSSYSRY